VATALVLPVRDGLPYIYRCWFHVHVARRRTPRTKLASVALHRSGPPPSSLLVAKAQTIADLVNDELEQEQ
jgi:hypothetical protein